MTDETASDDLPEPQKTPDLHAIRAEEGKKLEDYDVNERRAAILRQIIQNGTPHGLNQRKTAEAYGVSPRMIRKDLKAISEYIGKSLGTNLSLTVQALFERTVADLREDDRYKEAWDVAMEYSQWLADVGAIQYEPDRVQVENYDGNAGPQYQVVDVESDVTDSSSDSDDSSGDISEDETEDGSIPAGFAATPGSGASGDDALGKVADGEDDEEPDHD